MKTFLVFMGVCVLAFFLFYQCARECEVFVVVVVVVIIIIFVIRNSQG